MNIFRQRQTPEYDAKCADEITAAAGVSPLTARTLICRGITTAEEAKAFLHPNETQFLDPFDLPDMEAATARIRLAIARGEKICVFGDYDADGVCATAILVTALKKLGGNVCYHLPLRHKEGYGMTKDAVEKLISDGVNLIVTVDNGVSAFDEIALCGANGIDVVVTDHHSVSDTLPKCCAVVAASRKDGAYQNPALCGAGVAFKLVAALTDDGYDDDALALAAVATIADVVPLTGENRALSICGMRHIPQNVGLSVLCELAGVNAPITEQTVSFVIAPRLNAAGRMSSAAYALELLLCGDMERAKALAAHLDADNQARRETESAILDQAMQMIADTGVSKHAILLAHDEWNPGVIGIVASRLCEKYDLPVLLFSETDGVLTGSGRSIDGIDLFACLSAFSHLFMRYGGHARAAGVTMKAEKFEAFRAAFVAYIEREIPPEAFHRVYEYDDAIHLSDLTLMQTLELQKLAPFGEGNPEPVFRINDVRFASPRTMGKDARHFAASVVEDQSVMRVVAFGKGELLETLQKESERKWDLLAKPTVNTYRGTSSVELLWVAAAESARDEKVFNAFFEECLYNDSCSDDILAEWFFSFCSQAELGEPNDESLRTHYRTLRSILAGGAVSREKLYQTLSGEEQFSLCVFLQLGFFSYDAREKTISLVADCKRNDKENSALYRLRNIEWED